MKNSLVFIFIVALSMSMWGMKGFSQDGKILWTLDHIEYFNGADGISGKRNFGYCQKYTSWMKSSAQDGMEIYWECYPKKSSQNPDFKAYFQSVVTVPPPKSLIGGEIAKVVLKNTYEVISGDVSKRGGYITYEPSGDLNTKQRSYPFYKKTTHSWIIEHTVTLHNSRRNEYRYISMSFNNNGNAAGRVRIVYVYKWHEVTADTPTHTDQINTTSDESINANNGDAIGDHVISDSKSHGGQLTIKCNGDKIEFINANGTVWPLPAYHQKTNTPASGHIGEYFRGHGGAARFGRAIAGEYKIFNDGYRVHIFEKSVIVWRNGDGKPEATLLSCIRNDKSPTSTTDQEPSVGSSTGSSSSGSGDSPCTGLNKCIDIDQRYMTKGREVTIPIWYCKANNLTNMDLIITYPTYCLDFIKSIKGSLNNKSMFQYNETSTGRIKISFAATEGVSGTGTVAYLTFKVVGRTGSICSIKGTILSENRSSGKSSSRCVSNGRVRVGNAPQNTNGNGSTGSGTGVKRGDCDGDGKISAADALVALFIAVEKRKYDDCYDVNNDDTVNSVDATIILRRSVGIN